MQISEWISTKFGRMLGDGNPEQFWRQIFDIAPLTNLTNIFVKILHYGYRLFIYKINFLNLHILCKTSFHVHCKYLGKLQDGHSILHLYNLSTTAYGRESRNGE